MEFYLLKLIYYSFFFGRHKEIKSSSTICRSAPLTPVTPRGQKLAPSTPPTGWQVSQHVASHLLSTSLGTRQDGQGPVPAT